jgi:hypothetical protein
LSHQRNSEKMANLILWRSQKGLKVKVLKAPVVLWVAGSLKEKKKRIQLPMLGCVSTSKPVKERETTKKISMSICPRFTRKALMRLSKSMRNAIIGKIRPEK